MRRLFIFFLAALFLGRTAEAQNSYFTTFPLTENPISEGGRWINGGTVGLTWKNCRTTPGRAFGTQTGTEPHPPYDDSTCVLNGTWGRTQTAEATVFRTGTPSGYQEIELRLLTTITPNRIAGYEVLFSATGNSYVQIVRWDGGQDLPSFHYVTNDYGPQLATGHRVKATVDANGLLRAYVDTGSGYMLISQGTDTTYTTGSPGLGFWNRSSTSSADYGVTSFSASDGTGAVPPAAPTGLRIIVSEAQVDEVFPYFPLFLRPVLAFDRDRRLRVPLPATAV